MIREQGARYQAGLPSFASDREEIRIAVEQNAQDRGVLLIKVLISLHVDDLMALIEELGRTYDGEEFYESAGTIGVDVAALKIIDQADPPIPHVYYFCTPDLLMKHPALVFYYRNIAMLSRKVMRGIGLSTEAFEDQGAQPNPQMATDLSQYFNKIVSALIVSTGQVTRRQHFAMMMANVGDALGGVSRNEVGRVAMMRILNPLVECLHARGLLASVLYSLKGQITLDDEDDSGAQQRTQLEVNKQTDIQGLLQKFETHRVLYHEICTSNGSKLILNAQLKWQDSRGEGFKIGPDLCSQVGENDMFWASELKGGADPAGSDEHWKTATQALHRILEAAQATGRPKPRLSFIATILVERVARDAQAWIDRGDLRSVYNLTQMYGEKEEMDRYLNDMLEFLGY